LRILAVRGGEDLHEAGVHGLAPPAHTAEEQRAGHHQPQASYKLRNKEAALHTKKRTTVTKTIDEQNRMLREKKSVLRIRDVYPGSCFLSIPDSGSNNSNKRKGEQKFVVLPFNVSTNITQIKN
jgi:hypothetical protein